MEPRTRSRRTVIELRALAVLAVLGALATLNAVEALTLSGPDLPDGGRLPLSQVGSSFGCHGGDRSPTLAWSGVPTGAHSLAVTLFDPDANGGQGFWHWALLDLSPKLRGLPPGAKPPESRAGRNDFGTLGYGGACPPEGGAPHRYVFTVWALPEWHAPFGSGTRDQVIGIYLRRHALARGSLTLHYGR